MRFNEQLTKIVSNILKTNGTPMLLGEPGIGKSSWVINLANEMNTEVFVLACNQLADKSDLTGVRLVPDNKGGYENKFYPHTVINQAIDYAENHPTETPILFLDELNRTTPDVTSEALSLPTLRSIGDRKLPENLRIVTAGNDKGNVTSLDSASISRFVLIRVEPDTQTYINLDPNLNTHIKTVLLKHPDYILEKSMKLGMNNTDDDDDDDNNYGTSNIDDILDEEDISQMTTPRTITALSKWLNLCTKEDLMDMINSEMFINGEKLTALQEIIEGFVGRTKFSAELITEIANNSLKPTDSNSNEMIKPLIYDKLKSVKTTEDLDNLLKTISRNDKIESLIYSLYENKDNKKIILTLLDNIDASEIQLKDLEKLIKMLADDSGCSQNMDVLMSTTHPISDKLRALLN